MSFFVRNSQFLTTFSSSASKYSSTVSGFHSGSETMLISSFSLRRLECSFHRYTNVFIMACKIKTLLLNYKVMHNKF